jgi:hypothetical protein
MACERPPAGRFAPAAVPLGEGDNYSPLDFISFRSVGKLVSPSRGGTAVGAKRPAGGRSHAVSNQAHRSFAGP